MGRGAKIVVLPGDGIGPEVADAALTVLRAVAERFSHRFEITPLPIGASAIRSEGTPLPERTREACLSADAVFLAAVGDPSFDDAPPDGRPEAGLLRLRKALGVYANLRPARIFPGLENAGPLRREVAGGPDLLIVRELTGGLYFGTPRGVDLEAGTAVNTLPYTREEIARVADLAFRLARSRRRLVTSVDKSNVLETSRLWRAVVNEVGEPRQGTGALRARARLGPVSGREEPRESDRGDRIGRDAAEVVALAARGGGCGREGDRGRSLRGPSYGRAGAPGDSSGVDH